MSRELGTLVVVILKARNLLDRHSLYKQDVYAQASLNGKTKKTQVDVKGGQHPEWDEEVRFTVYDSKSEDARTLKVSCWSKEPRGDETVGEGKLDISETLRTGEFDDWIPLQVDGTSRGELYLEMTFYAAGPPPLSRRPSKLAPKDRLSHMKPMSQSTGAHSLPKHSPKYNMLPPLPEESTSPPPVTELPSILRPGPGRPQTTNLYPAVPNGHHRTTSSDTPPNPTRLPSVSPPESPQRHPLPALTAQGKSASFTPASLMPGPVNGIPRPTSRPEQQSQQSHSNHSSRHSSPQSQFQSLPQTPLLPQNNPSTPFSVPEPAVNNGYSYIRPPEPFTSNEPGFTYPRPEYLHPSPASTYPYTQPYSQPSQPQRPYPYNYPPQSAPDSEIDLPDPFVTRQLHRPSFPLPDEPEGVHTPTQANPYGYVQVPGYSVPSTHHYNQAPRPLQSPFHPQLAASPRPPPKQPVLPTRYSYEQEQERERERARIRELELELEREKARERERESEREREREMEKERTREFERIRHKREEEERDQRIALAIEQEEEERKRKLKEQEDLDMELARKLDMELNLNLPAASE